MSFKRIIGRIFLVGIPLLAIVLILLFTLDLKFLRGTIENQVSQATGREFSIEENFSLRLGRELVISASSVRLGNPAWSEEENFVHLARLDAVIDLKSLWKGPVLIRQLDADGVDVHLEQNDEDQANWVMASSGTAQSKTGILPFVVEHGSISNVSITLQQAQNDQPLQANISKLQQSLEPDGHIHLNLTGELNGEKVQFEAEAGPYARLLNGDDITLKGSGTFGEISVSGIAELENAWAPQRPVIDLKINGPEFEQLTNMLGIQHLGSGDLSFSAVSSVVDSMLETRIAGNFGEFDVDINSRMPSIQDYSSASLQARLSGPNFGRVAGLFGYEDWPDEAFRVDSTLDRDGTTVHITRFDLGLAGAEFGFSGNIPGYPSFSGAELDLQIRGDDLGVFHESLNLDDIPGGAFAVTGTVAADENKQTYVDIMYETTLANGSISGKVGTGENLEGSELKFTASGDDTSAVGEFAGISTLQESPWNAEYTLVFEDGNFIELKGFSFNSDAYSLTADGRFNTDSIDQGTDLAFLFQGERLSDFQTLVNEKTVLPEEAFSLAGRVKAMPSAWELEDITAEVSTTRVIINGQLGKGESLAGTELAVGITGRDLGKVFDLPGEARLPDGPFSLESDVGLDVDRLRIASVQVTAGSFSHSMDADLPWPLDTSQGHFKMQTKGNNITRVLPELAGLDLDAEDYEVSTDGSWRDGQISIQQGFLRIGESTLTAQGTLDLPPNLSATDFQFELHSPDLSRLGTVDNERWGMVPVDLSSSFSGTNTKFLMEQFDLHLGDSKVKGDFAIDFEGEIPVFDLKFTTDTLNLRPFLTSSGETLNDEESKNEDGVEEESERLIPDFEFPMEMLARFEGSFAILADEVLLKNTTIQGNVLRGQIKEGSLHLDEMGTDGYQGRLVSTFSLEPGIDGSAAELKMTLQSEELIINLSGQPEEDKKVLPAFNIDINLETTGKDLREAASVLNGNITLDSPGGLVRNRDGTSAASLFFIDIITAISPNAARQEETNISCVAAAINVNEGVIMLDPGFAVQSDKLNLFASGEIDLESEKIDINFRSTTRKAATLSASELVSPYVKLSGTLADPSIALDPKGTLISGGAAFLSGGLSILAKKALDQMGGTKDPCADYLEANKQVTE